MCQNRYASVVICDFACFFCVLFWAPEEVASTFRDDTLNVKTAVTLCEKESPSVVEVSKKRISYSQSDAIDAGSVGGKVR